MFRIYSRFETGELCKWQDCRGCVSPLASGDPEAARTWLSGFLLDDARASELRRHMHASGDGLGLGLLSHQQLLDQMSRLIASGELRVCGMANLYTQDSAIQTTSGVAPPGPPPAPVGRSRSAPLAPPPPEETTLPRNVDAAAVAAVLTAAAAEGVPFCEICEKQKQPQPVEAGA
jgi:hypothetical protein